MRAEDPAFEPYLCAKSQSQKQNIHRRLAGSKITAMSESISRVTGQLTDAPFFMKKTLEKEVLNERALYFDLFLDSLYAT